MRYSNIQSVREGEWSRELETKKNDLQSKGYLVECVYWEPSEIAFKESRSDKLC